MAHHPHPGGPHRRARWAWFSHNLGRLQVQRPWTVLGIMALSLIPALILTSQLELRSGFRELLPESQPSVIELNRLSSRMGGMGTLVLVIDGGEPLQYRRFIDALAPRLRALGPSWVTGVDDGMRHLEQFVRNHWWAYLSTDELERLRDELEQAKDREVMKRSGFGLDLEEEEPEGEFSVEALRERFSPDTPGNGSESLPDYYIGKNGDFAAIVVRTSLGTGDDRVTELQARIGKLASEVAEEIGAPDLQVRFTGSLVTSVEEHRAVVGDLTHVGLAGVSLILLIVFAYFLRFRALVAMAITIAVGCSWSFAFAKVAIGHLNSASGFMVSIIAGNGINFGIIFMARYLEARHEDGLDAHQAIAQAKHDTWSGTLTAAAAASVAYGSLAVTQFPGFRQFGIIGGVGMLFCWLATYAFLPSILVASEQLFPIHVHQGDWRRRTQWIFAGPLYAIASAAPRAVAVTGILLISVGTIASAVYLKRDPMEYDLTRIRNEAREPGSARVLARRAATVVGRFSRDGRAIVVERVDHVPPLVAELKRRREAAPPDNKPFDRVVSILDLVPPAQEQKAELAADITRLVRYARRRGLVDDANWQELAPMLPDSPRPVRMDSLPSDIAWPFEEADGTRGRIVYLVPASGRSLNDARYLMQWADSFREIGLPDGHVVRGSGDPVIFADVLQSVREEAPRAAAVSLLGTVLVILVAFRLRFSGWLALMSVLGGGAMLLAMFWALGTRINFLNFMAIPITIGVGADYAVNVMRRHDVTQGDRTRRAFVRTGGAVMLCSLTTMLGYGALLTSINGAVRSFGFAAAAGEAMMILCATVLLPALVLWRER